MIVYVNELGEIKSVNTTKDASLTPVTIDENAESFPFKGWSNAKICCYKVAVSDGVVTMMTPYVDSRYLDTIDKLGHEVDDAKPYTETKNAYIFDTEIEFKDVPDGNLTVFAKDTAGFYPSLEAQRVGSSVIVTFEPLEYVTAVTISIKS